MWPYAIAFALPILLFPLRERSRLAYVYLLTAGWVAFAAIRLDIGGNDFFAYRDFYNGIDPRAFPFGNGWEPLYKGLAFASRNMGLSYHGFLGLVALLGILPAVYVIDKRSPDTPIGFFTYGIQWMLYGSFVILRQGIAVGIAFLALDALLDKRLIRFFIAAIVSAGFHYSGLTLLVLPLFTEELKPRLRTALIVAAGAAFFAIEVGNYSNFFALLDRGVARRLAQYLTVGLRGPLNILNVVEVAGFSFIIARYAPRSPAQLRNGYFLYMLCIILSLEHSIIQRMGRYSEISLAILLALVADPDGDRPRERNLVAMGLVLYFLAKIGRWILVNADGPGGFLPYRTIL